MMCVYTPRNLNYDLDIFHNNRDAPMAATLMPLGSDALCVCVLKREREREIETQT